MVEDLWVENIPRAIRAPYTKRVSLASSEGGTVTEKVQKKRFKKEADEGKSSKNEKENEKDKVIHGMYVGIIYS